MRSIFARVQVPDGVTAVARQRDATGRGSWSYALELFERGDPLFVDEVRGVTDADRLGDFAARWFADRRPEARQLLFNYLSRPLNAFRHEALVKRFFKLAEKAGDDDVMARFLAAFDRSVRRVQRTRHQSVERPVASREEAQALAERLTAGGFTVLFKGSSSLSNWQTWFSSTEGMAKVDALAYYWGEETLAALPGTTMSRPKTWPNSDWFWRSTEKLRLFSLATRRYLCRRAWRYFRKLGQTNPERYVAAAAAALKLYEDADVASGLALIDNWGLVHILFHHSPVLVSKRNGWVPAPGQALSELQPAPIYEEQWQTKPLLLIDLVKNAHCRPVRQWAIFMVRRHAASALQALSSDELFSLLAHEDPAVVGLAVEVIRAGGGMAAFNVNRLLDLLETPNPETLEILCGLLGDCVGPERVMLEQAVRLTAARPLPLARLGFAWLRGKSPASAADCQGLLRLVDAGAEPLRPEIVRWLRGVLAGSTHFRADWVLELLDCRHPDVRREGWAWLREDQRLRDDVAIWRKLLESPYDDVRLRLVADLEERVRRGTAGGWENGALDDELVRFLWASVLLNIQRGRRSKPLVVAQLVRRLQRHSAEAATLLPILAVALRSLRGPEWRAGLVGVVQLVERNAELAPVVQQVFPELKLVI
jgi:hypothetical protein